MSFPPLKPRTVRWRQADGDGLEHLDLRAEDGAIVAESVVIGSRGGAPYGVRYRIVCDQGWTVQSLDLTATSGQKLGLRSDGEGEWTDGEGWPIPHLDGCIDIDLAGSPFTNTLPIRRLGLSAGSDTVELKMAYVPFDSFEPVVDGQRYRGLEQDRLYRYEAADRTFAADLPVDEDGLVTDYPGLFERVPI
jgi:uncharacterized protein